MQQTRRRVLFSVACVLVVFCVVRAVRRPAASDGAQRVGVDTEVVQVEERATNARPWPAVEYTETSNFHTTQELQRQRLETARVAERIERQEAAGELQRRR